MNICGGKRGGQRMVAIQWVFGRVYGCQITKLIMQMADKNSPPKNMSILSLIRLKPQCKISPVRVDFQTPLLSSPTTNSIVPSFNTDRAYFTPSFILPHDKKYYQENQAFQKCQFEEKIQRCVQQTNASELSLSSEELRIASPHSNYCQICQQKFEDYFIHIEKKTHQMRSINSQATAQIQLLCLAFQRQAKMQAVNSKRKLIHKQSKRQQKVLSQNPLNTPKRRPSPKIYASSKGQNYSTNVPEDSPIDNKE